MNEGYRYDRYGDPELLDPTPAPGDLRDVAQILRQELIRNREQVLLNYIEACFEAAEDVISIGDLLDKVKEAYGDEKMTSTLELLWTMQSRGEAVLYEDNDRQRLVVERLRSNK